MLRRGVDLMVLALMAMILEHLLGLQHRDSLDNISAHSLQECKVSALACFLKVENKACSLTFGSDIYSSLSVRPVCFGSQ